MHTTTSTILQWQTNKTNFSFEKRVWPGLTISDALLANQNATKKLADDKNSINQCKIFSLGLLQNYSLCVLSGTASTIQFLMHDSILFSVFWLLSRNVFQNTNNNGRDMSHFLERKWISKKACRKPAGLFGRNESCMRRLCVTYVYSHVLCISVLPKYIPTKKLLFRSNLTVWANYIVEFYYLASQQALRLTD